MSSSSTHDSAPPGLHGVEAGELMLAPEAIEQELEARRRKLAQPNRDANAAGTHDPLLVFALAGERYAFDASYVWGVERLPELTPVPGSPEAIVGITILRGVLVPVADLRRLLSLDACALSDVSRIVLVGRERLDFALLADSVEGLQPIGPSQVLPLPETSAWGADCVRGMTSDGIIVVDAAAVIDSDRLRTGPMNPAMATQEHDA